MRRLSILPMMLAPALVVLAACGDDVTDPEDLLASAEAEAVMESAESLPLLPTFLDEVDVEADRDRAELVRARELWDGGTAIDDSRGDAKRRLAVSYAAPILVNAVPPTEWVSARADVDAWMQTARSMLRHLTIPSVATQLERADRHLARSDRASSDRARIYYLLLASSELVETTPRFVARSMTHEAQAAVLAASLRDEELDTRTLERATRLKDWAVQAVEEGEYLLAIQRAYYAMQLVEAE